MDRLPPPLGLVQLQWWLLLCLLLLVPAAAQVELAPCTLEIEGFYTKDGIRKASLACGNGTTVPRMAAHPEFRPFVKDAPGVVWGGAQCGALNNITQQSYNCLLRVCIGSFVHFKNLRIVGLVAPEYTATVCIEGGTSVNITNATFSDNQASFIGTTWAEVNLINSTMANNIGIDDYHIAGIGFKGSAVVNVEGCSFLNNTAATGGSAIRAMGDKQNQIDASEGSGYAAGTLNIKNCTFRGNSAVCSGCAGGAIAVFDNSQVTINRSVFVDNGAAVGGGAIAVSDSAQVTAQNSRFINNSMSKIGGVEADRGARISQSLQEGGAVLVKDKASVILRNSSLVNNFVHSHGGAVAVKANASALLDGCTFTDNTVRATGGKGGALYIEGSTNMSSTSLTRNSAAIGGAILLAGSARLRLGKGVSLSENTAQSHGGGVTIESKTAVVDTFAALRAVATGNNATYDPNLSVPIEKIDINGNISVVNLTSRVSASEGLIMVRVTVLGWSKIPSQYTEIEAVLEPTTRNQTVARNQTAANGTAEFTNLKLQEKPGAYDVIFRPKGQAGPTAKLVVNIIGCPLGDVRVTDKACFTCPKGDYSFNPDNTTCDRCPINAECGNNTVVPLRGYWSSSDRSAQMHRCRNPKACPGNASNACTKGYKSNMCGVCESGFGSSAPFTCRPCWGKGVIVMLYALAALLMLAFSKALCFFTLDFALQQGGAGQPAAANPQPAHTAPNEILKPFCIYLQFSFIVMGMQGVSWPASLSKVFEALQVLFAPSSPQTLSLECILPRSSAMPVPVQVFLLTVAMPVLLLVALLVFETGKAFFASRNSKSSSPTAPSAFAVERKRLVAQSVIVCFLFYPMLLRAVMGLFACIPLDKPVSPPYEANPVGSFWAGDMAQMCFTGYHRGAALGLGIPLLVLLVLVLPATMLGFIMRHRQDLYSDRFRKFSFMFSMYRPKKAWWEVVVLLQTATLVAISVFGVGLGTYYSCLLLTAALAVIMVLHAWMRPFTSVVAGRTSLRGLACVFFTSFAALSFLPVGTVYGQFAVNEAYAIAAGAVVVLLNVAYVVSVAVELVRAVRWTAVASMARKVMGACCAVRGGQQGGKDSDSQEAAYSEKTGPTEKEEA